MSDQYKFNNDLKNIPVTDSLWRSPIPTQPNIDLRDWFAGMAMQGFCASQSGADWSNATIAREAYMLADEMIKAREAK